MKSTAAFILLLTLISIFLYVSGTPVDIKSTNIPNVSKILLNNHSDEFIPNENITEKQIKISSEKLKEIVITEKTIAKNLSTTIKTPLAFEAKDMEFTFVHPKDDDDDDNDNDNINNSTAATLSTELQEKIETTATSIDLTKDHTLKESMMKDEKHATLAAKIFSDNPNKSITNLPLDVQRKFTHETYLIGRDEANTTKESVSLVGIVPIKSTTIESLNMPTVRQSFLTLETRENIVKKHSNMIESEGQNEKEKIPTGIIALISAIGFATLAIVTYIGLIGWKQYQEYLHGHRELLINDFDSNDINNFEL